LCVIKDNKQRSNFDETAAQTTSIVKIQKKGAKKNDITNPLGAAAKDRCVLPKMSACPSPPLLVPGKWVFATPFRALLAKKCGTREEI
jgi:hypothetical protein